MAKRTTPEPGQAAPLRGARGVATVVLHRVATDAAYAARALDAEIARARLNPRDARLATEIVYGALRALPALDARLDRQLARGRPDPFTLAALRAATYQALALSRVPSFAIVQETVSIVRQKRGEGMAKLTNAVLRRVVEDRPAEPRAPERLIVPDWVEASLRAGLGEARAARYLELGARPPPLSLRARAGQRANLLASLREAEPAAELCASEVVPDAVLAWGIGDPRKLPGYRDGLFAVQDEGAQLVGALVGAQPGERVLDACAGRGGKTLQLIEAVGAGGHVAAVDLHARKLEQLAGELARLGHAGNNVSTAAVDLSVGAGGLAPHFFDRVLVDAPCTGLGTLQRRPELLLRLGPGDPGRMATLQRRILTCAAGLLRPGGVLIYAVCAGTREEAQGVAEAIEPVFPGLRRLTADVAEVSVPCDGDGVFRIGPWQSPQGGCPDVYQVVRWEMLDSHLGPV